MAIALIKYGAQLKEIGSWAKDFSTACPKRRRQLAEKHIAQLWAKH